MAGQVKKQNFLEGAAVLAIATAVVKLIGAFYKIPLKMIIGDKGYGYFITAYDIYAMLLLVSTAGLPVAMSRMISQANALNNHNQVRQVYKTALGIFLALGSIGTLLMMGLSGVLAQFQKQPDAAAAIFWLGPCALLMGIISAFRGFFQGQEDMRPTSVSQVLEAFFKLVVGLALAFVLMKMYNDVSYAAAGAIIGVTVSCVVSVGYLYKKFAPAYRSLPACDQLPLSWKTTAKGLLAIAVPITIGSAGLQMLTLVEQNLYMGQLLTAGGHSQDVADTMKGIYSMSMTIFNMPCAFIVPITISVIPAITAALTRKEGQIVKETEESAARVAGLICLPCSVGLFVLARPVMALLGGYEGEKLDLATSLMAVLGLCIFFYGVIQYTNSLLQAHGYAKVPVIHMLSCGVVKLLVVYLLVGNPNIGILGAPLGALLCYVAIGILNLIAINRLVPEKPKLLKNLTRAVIPAVVMGLVVFCAYQGLICLLGADTSVVILCGLPVVVGVVIYCVMAVLCKAITAQDCRLLPKGDKIAKLLRL